MDYTFFPECPFSRMTSQYSLFPGLDKTSPILIVVVIATAVHIIQNSNFVIHIYYYNCMSQIITFSGSPGGSATKPHTYGCQRLVWICRHNNTLWVFCIYQFYWFNHSVLVCFQCMWFYLIYICNLFLFDIIFLTIDFCWW